ncbi:MAG: transposase [Bacteroidetes bacterium]|nr:transposase [Bacteroidota bacterium]
MYRTQSNQIRQLSKDQYNLLQKLCWHSARLYNFGLYSVRQNFFETKTYLPYPQNYHYCKTNENFQILPSVTGQQTLKVVDRSFKSFFGLLKAKKQNKYQSRISLPKYLPKDGYFQLVIPKNGFQIKEDKIHIGISRQLKEETGLKNIVLDFPTQIEKGAVQEIRIIPQQKATFFKMEVVYKVKEQDLNLNQDNVLSIDIGLSNLATCYDISNNRAFIMDGKKLKSINYYWNKQNAKLQAIKDKQNIKGCTKRQFLLKRKRENCVKDVMRKTAKYILDYCIEHNIGTIIVGHNKGWKQEINIGKRNNQNFVQVPFGYLMSILESKCQEYGLKYLETQESHTSKCSAIDNEPVKHHDEYVGKRVKRGLFRSKDGLLINSDVNGAINIARKSKVTSMEFTPEMIKGIVAYPKRIRVANI